MSASNTAAQSVVDSISAGQWKWASEMKEAVSKPLKDLQNEITSATTEFSRDMMSLDVVKLKKKYTDKDALETNLAKFTSDFAKKVQKLDSEVARLNRMNAAQSEAQPAKKGAEPSSK